MSPTTFRGFRQWIETRDGFRNPAKIETSTKHLARDDQSASRDPFLFFEIESVNTQLCRSAWIWLAVVVVATLPNWLGCAPAVNKAGNPLIQFLDEVETNRDVAGGLDGIEFVDAEGQTVGLDAYRGNKNVLLVFTRGFSGMLCPYCTTQTSRLIANYDKFTSRNTEVLLVYPGTSTQLPAFQEASIRESGRTVFPFPVLLDEDLAAVNRLDIAASLAQPSTFLIDTEGKIRLAYVGTSAADRPSIQALLDQIDSFNP